MVDNKTLADREHDRRARLSTYLFDVSKLLISGVGIGGLSPLITGKEMTVNNYVCVVIGALAAFAFAYCANRITKIKNDK